MKIEAAAFEEWANTKYIVYASTTVGNKLLQFIVTLGDQCYTVKHGDKVLYSAYDLEAAINTFNGVKR